MKIRELASSFTAFAQGPSARHRGTARPSFTAGAALLILLISLMLTGCTGLPSGKPAAAGTEPDAAGKEAGIDTGKGQEQEQTASAEGTNVSSGLEGQNSLPAEEKADASATESQSDSAAAEDREDTPGESAGGETDVFPAPDFELQDQYGYVHRLSDYRGRIVFLNFWATWCPPCRAEMPDIQALYEDTFTEDDPDLVILAVAFPASGGETSVSGICDFLEENGYTYPVLMDRDADLMSSYYISAFPTTYMIDREGNIFGYVTGSMDRAAMDDIIRQTREKSENRSQ